MKTTIEVNLSTHWVTPIFYGDVSALEDSEIKQLEEYLKNLSSEYITWSLGDSVELETCEITGLLSECVLFKGTIF